MNILNILYNSPYNIVTYIMFLWLAFEILVAV